MAEEVTKERMSPWHYPHSWLKNCNDLVYLNLSFLGWPALLNLSNPLCSSKTWTMVPCTVPYSFMQKLTDLHFHNRNRFRFKPCSAKRGETGFLLTQDLTPSLLTDLRTNLKAVWKGMLFFLLVEVFPLCRQEHQAAKLLGKMGSSPYGCTVRTWISSPDFSSKKSVSSSQWSNFSTSDRKRFHADRKENHITLVIPSLCPNLSPWAAFYSPERRREF